MSKRNQTALRQIIMVLASLALGGLLTWLAFKGTDWPAVAQAMGECRYRWLVLAAISFAVAHCARAHRFGFVVRATMPANYRSLFASVQIGALAQMTLPIRAGSFVRAVVLSRLIRRPFAGCYGAVALDRVPELALIGVMMLIALIGLPHQEVYRLAPGVLTMAETREFPGRIIHISALVVGVLFTLRLGLLAGIYLNKAVVLRVGGAVAGIFSKRLAEGLCKMIDHFAESLHIFSSAGDMIKAVLWSIVFWGLFVVAFTCILLAFGIAAPWYTPILLVVLTAISLVVPGMPGFIGQFHLAVVLSLVIALPDLLAAQMLAFAIVSHAVYVAVITCIGVGSLIAVNVHILETVQRTSAQEAES
jgi:uncharacterized protein (TIRG00374 family)